MLSNRIQNNDKSSSPIADYWAKRLEELELSKDQINLILSQVKMKNISHPSDRPYLKSLCNFLTVINDTQKLSHEFTIKTRYHAKAEFFAKYAMDLAEKNFPEREVMRIVACDADNDINMIDNIFTLLKSSLNKDTIEYGSNDKASQLKFSISHSQTFMTTQQRVGGATHNIMSTQIAPSAVPQQDDENDALAKVLDALDAGVLVEKKKVNQRKRKQVSSHAHFSLFSSSQHQQPSDERNINNKKSSSFRFGS